MNNNTNNLIEVGVDEVGRGCLFGRVYAAAVIWNPNLSNCFDDIEDDINLIRDSKRLSEKKRNYLSEFIKEYALDYSIAYVEHDYIDEHNILKSSIIAMHKALDNLHFDFDKIMVDGNQFKNYYKGSKLMDHECIIKGDDKIKSISCASIIAKVARDNYIIDLCNENEDLNKYDFKNNKGYGTKKHIEGIEKYGITKLHRKSFCKNINYKI